MKKFHFKSLIILFLMVLFFSTDINGVSAGPGEPPIEPPPVEVCPPGEELTQQGCVPLRTPVDEFEMFLGQQEVSSAVEFDGQIHGSLTYNNFGVWNFTASASVDYTIKNAAGTETLYSETLITDANGDVYLYPSVFPEIGHQHIAVDVSTGESKTLIIPAFFVTGEDLSTDTVSGTAPVSTNLTVAYRHASTGTYYHVPTTSDGSGNWSTDFTSQIDMQPFGYSYAYLFDDDGDIVFTYPRHIIATIDQNEIILRKFTLGNTASVTIKDSPGGSIIDGPDIILIWDSYTPAEFEVSFPPGTSIEATDTATGVVKELTVADLEITSVDLATDIVSGTAPANDYVEISAYNEFYWDSLIVQANSSGDWTANFTGIADLDTTYSAKAEHSDNENDLTNVYWSSPYIEVSTYSGVNSFDFTPNSPITIELWNGSTMLWQSSGETTDGNGDHFLHYNLLGCYMIQPSNTIKVIDGVSGITKELVYGFITSTTVDSTNAIITGWTAPLAEVRVASHDQNGWVEKWVMADGSGYFTADFSPLGSTGLSASAEFWVYDSDGDSVNHHSIYDSYDRHDKVRVSITWDGNWVPICPGQTAYLATGWLATTTQFVQDYIDAWDIGVSVDGTPLFATPDDARPYMYPISSYPTYSYEDSTFYPNAAVSRFYYSVDALTPGSHTVVLTETLSTQIDDGWDLYGPGPMGPGTATITLDVQAGVCYALNLSEKGSGAALVANPTNSTGCVLGAYIVGESVELTAFPDSGWEVTGWLGTTNDSSTGTTNTLIMPASVHAASVSYAEEVTLSPPYTDFDGDGMSDPAKFYPSTGTVSWLKSSTDTWDAAWLGPETFDYVPRSDFDGDGISDPGKFNSIAGTVWYIKSGDSAWEGQYLGVDSYTYHEGSDFDGDGKTDPTKLIPNGAIWYIKSSTDAWEGFWLGPEAFEYVTGDFDGDGMNDPAKFVANPGVLWYWESSTSGWVGIFLGSDAYEYVSGSDFDGDGKTDPAKFYASTGTVWWLKSSTGLWDAAWMGPGVFDFVGGNDFDGDGKTDPAMYDPVTGILSWLKSSTGTWDSADMGMDAYELVN